MAAQYGLGSQHQLRITTIREGSTNLVLDVWDTIKKNIVDHLDAKQILESATTIVSAVFAVIRAKKHVDNKPYTTKIDANNGVIQIINTENVSIVLDPKQFAAFKNSSWLNQVECWFSIMTRAALKGASFTSPRQLREAINAFVQVYNETAVPFEWSKAVVHSNGTSALLL